MNTIKIFLASSEEMKDDRLAFNSFIGDENKTFYQKDIFLKLEVWPDFIDAMSATRLQDEYNKAIEECDVFIMLFFTKVGKYTEEEFEKAFQQFIKTKKPRVYTCFKTEKRDFDSLDEEDTQSLWAFKKKLISLGHFQTTYKNNEELQLHFKRQIDKLFAEGYFKFPAASLQIPKSLSAGQPSVPPGFLGRDIELADVKQKLEKYGLLLINAEGGMGKTTLAAKYLNENFDRYKHYAWLFCDKGVTEQIKTLAAPLNIDLTKYVHEDEQLLANKTAMQNLPKDCLLILDNANEPKDIEAFQKHFDGLQWHVLLTSRNQQVLPRENEYTLNHLEPEQARILFKTYHEENTAEFAVLLDKFLASIGYNTLIIELFSKNLHELSAIGETLADALEQCREKGLFLGERSFEIKTAWPGHVHRIAATTDEVLEVLYDLTKLEETDRKLLVNIALLPAESHLLTILIEALTPADKISFAKQLKALAQKGWLNTDTKSYRMSPVVQQIVLVKNKDHVAGDTAILISNLNKKLANDGATLIDMKAYSQAEPFAEFARSVTGFLNNNTPETALLLLNISTYYKSLGNFKLSLEQLNKAIEFLEKTDKEKYIICLTSLGSIHQQQGNFKKALQAFEQCNDLCKELFEADPHKESLKNRLAISYEKLGSLYQLQGNFKDALQFFIKFNDVSKELSEANPQNESLKNWLAISYEKLGSVYQQQKDFKKTLEFFIKFNNACKELFEANPANESLKNWLAISYEKLGSFHQDQHDFEKALPLFKECNSLFKELSDANQHNESFKNWTAVSYEKLGYLYQLQKNFEVALQFFELNFNLTKELSDVNQQSVDLRNRLAISYRKLGSLYIEMEEPLKAKAYFQEAETILVYLTELSPEVVEYHNSLEDVKNQLESM